jgi:hypothetical protein
LSSFAVLLVAGCVTPEQRPFLSAKGAYQTFAGAMEDGTPFTGAAWVVFGEDRGRFCAVASRKFRCEGSYDARDERLVVEEGFTCSRGLDGRARTERVRDAGLRAVAAVRGAAALSDGGSARYAFEPLRPWNGEAFCG